MHRDGDAVNRHMDQNKLNNADRHTLWHPFKLEADKVRMREGPAQDLEVASRGQWYTLLSFATKFGIPGAGKKLRPFFSSLYLMNNGLMPTAIFMRRIALCMIMQHLARARAAVASLLGELCCGFRALYSTTGGRHLACG